MEVQREQNKSLGARLVNLLVTVVIAYVLALVAIRLFESHLIFFPNYPGRLEGDWHPRNLPVQDVWLSSSDGTRLHAWWMPKDHAKFTFLAFHGKRLQHCQPRGGLRISPRHRPTYLLWNTAATAIARANQRSRHLPRR